MELKIKPSHKNYFPLGGILIKQAKASFWIQEIQSLGLTLQSIQLFPIPNTEPNSIWGCFIVAHKDIDHKKIGKNEVCQVVSSNLFIPEKTKLYPTVTAVELENLFQDHIHIIHPEFGLVELATPVAIEDIIKIPETQSCFITKPQTSVFIPKEVKSFQVKPLSPEEALKNLEENVFPKKEKMKDKPLNILEKGKLGLYKMLFVKDKNEDKDAISKTEKTGILKALDSIINTVKKREDSWSDTLQQDFENLEKRNQKEIDKLMDLLKNNPEEGLKYAIPLDNEGTTRGGEFRGQFNLSKRWTEFSLFRNTSGSQSGSGSINLGDHFNTLQSQYHATAESLIQSGDYQKAAFIYMKLLKNDRLAASTLESGKYFQEAASIYLKNNNMRKAAECYEKGNMIDDAISVYKDINENEKVGDLYVQIHNKKEADVYYKKVVEDYKIRHQYVKASLIYRNKINDTTEAQKLLLEGWRSNRDTFNCLNNYFSNIDDIKVLESEIHAIYKTDVTEKNRESFLQVIKYEYHKKNELSEGIKEMAYEIIAEHITINASIVSELKEFNPTDKQLIKDTVRFKVSKRS